MLKNQEPAIQDGLGNNMALTEKTVYETATDKDKNVRRRIITEIYRDGALLDSIVTDNRLIKPDDDIANESNQVKRELSKVFIPTVKDRAASQTMYAQAKADLDAEDTPANRKKESDAKTAMDAAKLAHKVFIDAEG